MQIHNLQEFSLLLFKLTAAKLSDKHILKTSVQCTRSLYLSLSHILFCRLASRSAYASLNKQYTYHYVYIIVTACTHTTVREPPCSLHPPHCPTFLLRRNFCVGRQFISEKML